MELFKRSKYGKVGNSEIPMVTITKRGIFYLNAASAAMLGNPTKVTLLYDHKQKRIAFKNEPDSVDAYKLMHPGGNAQGKNVRGIAFLKYHGITLGESYKRYHAYKEKDSLVFDLDEEDIEKED